MFRFFSVLAVTILIIILLASSAVAPTQTYSSGTDDFNDIFKDIVSDYALYESLLLDIYSVNQYRVSIHADDPIAACAYLSGGFDTTLAQTITDYYLQWIPELNKMNVIPTDSIPVITDSDKPFVNMKRLTPDTVVLERIYNNCYEMEDQYLYRITAQKRGIRWIVIDIQLEPVLNISHK